MKGLTVIFILNIFSFSACKTGSKVSIENIITSQRNIMPPDSIIQKQQSGVDLFARGNAPVDWSLEMDFDKLIVFRSADGTSIGVLPAFEKKEITAEIETYRIQTDVGLMTIQVFNTSCSVNGKDELYKKKVEVSIQQKLYSGCGKYLFDHRLHDIWILEMINNIPQSPAYFTKGLPTMQFDLQANKMTGSDGCNNIRSNIEIKGNRIKFSPFTSTRMSCNNNKAEKIFSEMVSNKLVDYYQENGRLILYLGDDSKLVFKRKEF